MVFKNPAYRTIYNDKTGYIERKVPLLNGANKRVLSCLKKENMNFSGFLKTTIVYLYSLKE